MEEMTASSSLCFGEASRKFKDKEISEEQYYHSILAHCTGYLHEEDEDDPLPGERFSYLRWDDVFAFAVALFMVKKDFVKDISPFEDAFQALANQDLRVVENAMTKLQDQHAKFLREILALRALQLRKAEVLQYCLQVGGFPYAGYFEDEADTVREEIDPLTFKALEESHFRKVYPRKGKDSVGNTSGDEDHDMDEMPEEEDSASKESGERYEAAVAFDKGGKFSVDW